jgi:hypothetical protein
VRNVCETCGGGGEFSRGKSIFYLTALLRNLKGLADKLAGLRGQRRDIADGAGARALWGTKGLANQVGEVGGAAVLAFGDLHEHTCYIEAHIFGNARQILTNLDLLLATFLTELLISERFSHFEREVRLAQPSYF